MAAAPPAPQYVAITNRQLVLLLEPGLHDPHRSGIEASCQRERFGRCSRQPGLKLGILAQEHWHSLVVDRVVSAFGAIVMKL